IWSELLGLDEQSISTSANFFALGGHSLLATQLVNRIEHAAKISLPLREVFNDAKLSHLEGIIDHSKPAIESLPLQPVARDGVIPLSYAQQRLWFLSQLEGSSAHYNMPLALRLRGPLDAAALSRSIEYIVDRHEVLRTRFETVD